MDNRKRPRSSTPTKDGSSMTKKKSKRDKNKTKKSKRNRSNSLEGAAATGGVPTPKTTKNSMDTTATTDGQMMAKMLSTFSKLEQSRFEAYQRVSFPVDAVGDWVAACLSHRLRIPNNRPLEDLVAVGQAGEIRTVVSSLAKTYAQRLVQSASRLKSAKSDGTQSTAALQPSDILRAYDERRAQGLDPGFFLQKAEERPALVLEPNDAFEQRRLAALEAQDEYDRQQNERSKEKEDSMEIDKE